jgi:hypothetical protein
MVAASPLPKKVALFALEDDGENLSLLLSQLARHADIQINSLWKIMLLLRIACTSPNNSSIDG